MLAATVSRFHLEFPHWHTDFYDYDLAQAAATKQRLFSQAASENVGIFALHFHPFPSLGHVVTKRNGWRWQPFPSE